MDVFLGIFERSYDKVSNFGVYTNAANLQSDSPEHAVAADSLVASFLGNLGPMSLVVMACVFSAVNRSLAVAALRGKISGAMPLIIVFTAFSFTTIVFEAFPMNLILPIGFWMALNNSPRRQLVEVAQ